MVMVGIKYKGGRIDFDGTDDSNPIPIGIAKKIISLGGIQINLHQLVLINALLNNGITTAVFKCIVDKIRMTCPTSNLVEDAFKKYPLDCRRKWSKCKTNPLRKLWILW
jgi:hypothetical protein